MPLPARPFVVPECGRLGLGTSNANARRAKRPSSAPKRLRSSRAGRRPDRSRRRPRFACDLSATVLDSAWRETLSCRDLLTGSACALPVKHRPPRFSVALDGPGMRGQEIVSAYVSEGAAIGPGSRKSHGGCQSPGCAARTATGPIPLLLVPGERRGGRGMRLVA